MSRNEQDKYAPFKVIPVGETAKTVMLNNVRIGLVVQSQARRGYHYRCSWTLPSVYDVIYCDTMEEGINIVIHVAKGWMEATGLTFSE